MAFLYEQLLVVEELEVQKKKRNRARLYRRRVRDAQNPFTIADSTFRRNFRLNKEAVIDLINAMTPYMNDGVRSLRIPKMLRVSYISAGTYNINYKSYVFCLRFLRRYLLHVIFWQQGATKKVLAVFIWCALVNQCFVTVLKRCVILFYGTL